MSFVLNIFIFFIYLILYFLFSANVITDLGGYIYLSAPLILIVFICGNLKSNISFFNILNIFNLSSLLFFFASPLVNLFISLDVFNFESIIVKVFSKRDLDFCSIVVIISISCINIGSRLKIHFFKYLDYVTIDLKFNRYLFLIGKWLMILSFPFILCLIYFQIKYILDFGYLTIYTGEIADIKYPLPYLSYVTYPFFYGFCLICSAAAPQKSFNKYVGLLLFVSLFESFKGGRFSLIGPILFFFWYSSVIYKSKYKPRKLLLPLLLLVALISVLTLRRDKSDNVDISKVTFSIIASQGRSVQLFSLYLENKEQVEKYGKYMITSNLLLPYLVVKYPSKLFQSQNTETVMISNNFKDIITYVLSPEYYLSGGGMGGTYIVEIYELGLVFCIFFSICFGVFLYNFSKLTINSTLVRFISYFLFLYIFIMPRAEALPNILNLFKFVFVYFLLKLGFIILNKSKVQINE